MRTRKMFATALSVGLGLSALFGGAALAVPFEGDAISEAQARRAALASYPGRVVDCDVMQSDDGSIRYEVDIRSGKMHRTVQVGADGSIQKVRFFSANGPGQVAYNAAPSAKEMEEDYDALENDPASANHAMDNAAQAMSAACVAEEDTAPEMPLEDAPADALLTREDAAQAAQGFYPGEVVWQDGPVVMSDAVVQAVQVRSGLVARTVYVDARDGALVDAIHLNEPPAVPMGEAGDGFEVSSDATLPDESGETPVSHDEYLPEEE